jgi:hypothetical protein
MAPILRKWYSPKQTKSASSGFSRINAFQAVPMSTKLPWEDAEDAKDAVKKSCLKPSRDAPYLY